MIQNKTHVPSRFAVKRCLLPFLLSVTVTSFAGAQTLTKYERNGKYGYRDETGRIEVHARYPFVYTDTIRDIGFVFDASSRQILCLDNRGVPLFNVFMVDNGPDYPSEGLFRIIGDDGLIGYSDLEGNIIIPPRYRFACPFKDGKARVSNDGYTLEEKEHSRWVVNNWHCIQNPLGSKQGN